MCYICVYTHVCCLCVYMCVCVSTCYVCVYVIPVYIHVCCVYTRVYLCLCVYVCYVCVYLVSVCMYVSILGAGRRAVITMSPIPGWGWNPQGAIRPLPGSHPPLPTPPPLILGQVTSHEPRAGVIEPGSADAAQSPGSMAPHRKEKQRYENLSSQKHRSLNPIQRPRDPFLRWGSDPAWRVGASDTNGRALRHSPLAPGEAGDHLS